MRRFLLLLLISLVSFAAEAHVGSPDVFYDGMVGPYPARITIRMPGVVPGRAEISVRVQTTEPVEVSFLPVYARSAVTNAPPPDVGRLVPGETGLYTGELWLMSFGAYSVEVRIKGDKGDGVEQIPVTSVAFRQLPLPSLLEKLLLLLGFTLVVGGIGIVAAAGREAALAPGVAPGKSERRRGFIAASIATIVFVLALAGGKHWWKAEEDAFSRHLLNGPWPRLAAEVRANGSERILRLEVGKNSVEYKDRFALIPDHGKLIHLFLVREEGLDAFAHLHPIRKGGNVFEVAVPPLPEGRYSIFCDLTFEGGVCSTATNSIVLPAMPAEVAGAVASERDPDDSWAGDGVGKVYSSGTTDPVCRLPGGERVMWEMQKPLRARQDASLRFTVVDAADKPVSLEPYMGMLCHAAVLRRDGSVFAHLHPAGNFSMAAQSFFENKMAAETAAATGETPASSDRNGSAGHVHGASAVSSVYLPYEFPEPGDYRIWVQFKIGGRVITAAFDAHVGS